MVFKCPHVGCDSSFPCKSKLDDHMNVHMRIRPYVCDVCESSYPSKKGLRFHERSHMPAQFVCEACSAAFTCNRNLSRHKKSCGRTFKCSFCPRVFEREGNYRNHLERRHPVKKEGPVKCGACRATFNSRSSCKTHYQIKHEGRRFRCLVCPKEFSYKHSLKVHMTKHTLSSENMKDHNVNKLDDR